MFWSVKSQVIAQSSVEDSTLGSIESIGNDMIKLLDRLSFGELDPTQRLEISPVLDNAVIAVDNSPAFQETKAKKTYLTTVKNELDTCLLYTSPSPRDVEESRMPSSA